MRKWILVGWLATALVGTSGCSTSESATDLHPEGPPQVLQVFVQERITYVDTTGVSRTKTVMQLAYGDHPDIPREATPTSPPDDRQVVNAVAKSGQKLRIVVDELLEGSSLEQLACKDGSFSDIPIDAVPDDIKKCSGGELGQCTAVCIGADGPIGILDENEDGASDKYRLKADAVTLTCGGAEMPIDVEKSFYNPSGNQQIPADPDLGLNGLGPAIVIVPLGLRTGSECTLTFADDVTDKDGNKICAAPADNLAAGCSAGDTSAITFAVQPFTFLGSDPDDGADDVRTTSSEILLQFNANLDPDSFGSITVEEAGDPIAVSYELDADDNTIVTATVTSGFQPATQYAVHVASGANGLLDVFGGMLAEDIDFSFSTRAGTPATPDAAPPEAVDAAPTPIDAGPATPDAAL